MNLMMSRCKLIVISFFTGTISLSAQQDTFLLFYLGGQSNMDGFGYNRDLPKPMAGKMKDVWIFTGQSAEDGDSGGGQGIWAPLQAGNGSGFAFDGRTNKLSDRFGVELSFAKSMQEAFPGKKIALLKYARGGTSIDSLAAGGMGCWEPDMKGKGGVNQYDHFLHALNLSLHDRDINEDGVQDFLLPTGILWMQGESDAAYTTSIAQGYEANLKRLIDLFRAALRQDDLPVVIGRISDSRQNALQKVWMYGELVQHAQEQFVRKDIRARIVRDTERYGYSDPWHYDSQGYLDLGTAFAREMVSLLGK
jgi:hypothetical protein